MSSSSALVVIIGFAAIRHRQAVTELEIGRREEAESFARILSSLSRSVSPDAILDAIVAELADASGADHIVVARRRPDARVLAGDPHQRPAGRPRIRPRSCRSATSRMPVDQPGAPGRIPS